MKGNAKPSLYFSAYPLKAVEPTTSKEKTGSPYLKAILSAKPKQPVTRARVFPMVNPYKNPYGANLDPIRARLTSVNKLPGDIELTENKWFHNYE